MVNDVFRPILKQAPLFELEETGLGQLELFPAVWGAAEDLTSPEAELRKAALDRLERLDAARFSPLIAVQLIPLLMDPDLAVRTQAVGAVAALLTRDPERGMAVEAVRQRVMWRLAQMRTRPIFALLQVCVADPITCEQVAALLKACPYAGGTLSNILGDRKLPVAIREAAAGMIGAVGYLDALPALERLEVRLEARQNGQQLMPFAPEGRFDEASLLPAVRAVLLKLRLP